MISISIHKMITIIKRLSALDVCICSVAQSYPTLCNPMDFSLPGSSVHGIFQARILDWIAISFSRGQSQPRERLVSLASLHLLSCNLSLVSQLCLTLCDPHELQPARLLHLWDFPGKSTGVGCHCRLQHECIDKCKQRHCSFLSKFQP